MLSWKNGKKKKKEEDDFHQSQDSDFLCWGWYSDQEREGIFSGASSNPFLDIGGDYMDIVCDKSSELYMSVFESL